MTSTEPTLLSIEQAKIDAMVKRVDTAALTYRLRMCIADQAAMTTASPLSRAYWAYEQQAIEAELAGRLVREMGR